jgi:hypothetical protein
MTDKYGRTFDEDVLAAGADDWIEPLDLLGTAADQGVDDRQTRRSTVIGATASLASRGFVVLGDVYDGFRPWDLPPGAAMVRAVRTWATFANCYDVMPGEVFWLQVTPEGEAIGKSVWAREEADGTRDTWDDDWGRETPEAPDAVVTNPYEDAVRAQLAANDSLAPSDLLRIATDQGITDPEARHYTALGAVVGLVACGVATLADPAPDGRLWNQPPGEAVTRAVGAWSTGSDPTPDDVFRLVLTPQGREVAATGA